MSEATVERAQYKAKLVEVMRAMTAPKTAVQIRRLVAPVEKGLLIVSILEELVLEGVVCMKKPEPEPGQQKSYRLWWLKDGKFTSFFAAASIKPAVKESKQIATPKISGSIIIPKQVLSDLLTALVDCGDNFTPEVEGPILTYTNKLQW